MKYKFYILFLVVFSMSIFINVHGESVKRIERIRAVKDNLLPAGNWIQVKGGEEPVQGGRDDRPLPPL